MSRRNITEIEKAKVLSVMEGFTAKKSRLDIQHAADLDRSTATEALRLLREEGVVRRKTTTINSNGLPGKQVLYWVTTEYISKIEQ